MKQLFHKPRHVVVEQYDDCKYFRIEAFNDDIRRTEYQDVEAFEVVEGEAAAQLETEMDPASIDDFHEYLILYLANGETATYRNSYVDLFTM